MKCYSWTKKRAIILDLLGALRFATATLPADDDTLVAVVS
jgi:hypothetical protein